LLRVVGNKKGGWKVDVPFADALADLIPPRATRLRRDYPQIIAAIKAHCLIHCYLRDENERGELIADLNLDYIPVASLIGHIASEGLLYRVADEEFVYSGGGVDWTAWQIDQGGWDAKSEVISPDMFIFEIQGPTSLFALEAATGESLRDIGFNRSRMTSISGIPVRILRSGISGELGYELHGSADDANAIWTAVVEAGTEHGIRQLGMRSQLVAHIEAGIATVGIDYLPSSIITIPL